MGIATAREVTKKASVDALMKVILKVFFKWRARCNDNHGHRVRGKRVKVTVLYTVDLY